MEYIRSDIDIDRKAHAASLRSVGPRTGCGHCPAHSHFGRDQCHASEAKSAFLVSDTKQEGMSSPDSLPIVFVCGGRRQRVYIWTLHIFPQGRQYR